MKRCFCNYNEGLFMGTYAANAGNCRALHPNAAARQRRWMKTRQKKFDVGKIEKLVRDLRGLQTADPQLPDKLREEADYFERNAARMRYPQFRTQKLFVGSGSLKQVAKQRSAAVSSNSACSGACAAPMP